MNYAKIKECDVANGPGVRVSVFVSGCNHHCKGCFNQEAWDFNYGKEFNQETIDQIIKDLDHDYVEGLSLLGGEPLEYNNQKGLLPLVKQVKEKFPNKTIWCYTGFDFERDVMGKMYNTWDETKELISDIDVIVDGKFEEEKKNLQFFKAGYGTEIEMCESFLNVCFNANDELLEGNTFVIFDTETTGFNPGLGDSMIEIGGVKIHNGEVVDRFDELINPGHHIDEQITRVTDISDDDVKDADNEENVIKRFKDWIGNLPLVAHNARFDKNMLDMAYYKYDLGKLENPIIDTLMLSRVINRDLKRHSLAALGKFYGIDTGEADDDEESVSESGVTGAIIDPEIGESFTSILVDGEEILNVEKQEYYDIDISTEEKVKKYRNIYHLATLHKASKSEEVHLEV